MKNNALYQNLVPSSEENVIRC